MYMKRILTLVIAVAILASVVSCSSGSGTQVSDANSDTLISGNSKELSIYILDYGTVTKSAIDKFNEDHKDVQI